MKFNLLAKVFCFVLFVLEPLYAEEENADTQRIFMAHLIRPVNG